MLKLHTYDIISSSVIAVQKLSSSSVFPLHGALFADWGTGKTIACKQVVKDFKGVFYYKATVRPLNPVQFFKDVLDNIGVFTVRNYVETYKNFISFLQKDDIKTPVLIIDEAQNIFTKPSILSLLKDLSEDLDIRLSYLFIGDKKLQDIINAPITQHAIIKRIKLRQKIPALTKSTIEKLASYYELEITKEDTEQILKISKQFKATTIDIDLTMHTLKMSKVSQVNINQFKEILKEFSFVEQTTTRRGF